MSTGAHQPALHLILWASASSWYYGYHLSELNFPVTSLTCLSPAYAPPSTLPLCLDIDSTRYSLITAIFTIGGLVGSLISSGVVKREGVKGGLIWTGWMNLLGVGLMSFAPSWIVLALGRFVSGVSSGIAVCLVPPFLSSVAKASPDLSNRVGQIGTINQMGIVLGLFSAQVAGMVFTGSKGDIPGNWRYVTFLPALVSGAQVLIAPRIYSPGEEIEGLPKAVERIRGQPSTLPGGAVLSPVAETDEAASPLLSTTQSIANIPLQPQEQLTLRSILSNPSLRSPTILCASIMCLQQFSGVNAVMFYSTPVLRPLMPGTAGAIGLGITGVNALMTVVAIILMDRVKRKDLLLYSIAGMVVTSALLAFGLNEHHNLLSACCIILFIVSFAVGLGPIPFLLISELVPPQGIPALSSLSLSLNWIAAFIVAILFLPLRDALSTPIDPYDPLSRRSGEGRVFYVFTAVGVILAGLVWRGFK